jgi:carotenoid cleavage dioxygenase
MVAGAATSPRPWWLRENFAPVHREVTETELTVKGSIPKALSGLYVRNGSNPKTGASPHWFLGDGMLHGVRLAKGRARWYRNRWVRTPMLANGTGVLSGGAPGGPNNQSNVSLALVGGKLLSLGEVGFPFEVSPKDLRTVGPYDFGGRLKTAMTAHPKVDPATGYTYFFGYGFVPPFLTYHVADASGELIRSEEIPVRASTMIHDFAITDRDAIFWELPVLFDLQMALRNEVPFRWDASYGARLGVLPLGAPASEIRWAEIDPCYVFHGINARRDGTKIVVDACRMPRVFAPGQDLANVPSRPHRWTIETAGAALRVKDEPLADRRMDLPTIDPRRRGRSYHHAWFAATRRRTDTVDFAGVVHRDVRRGRDEVWDPGAGRHAGEGLFVPEEGGKEGEGWVLTFLYDARRRRSELVILDATEVSKGPVARVAMPQRVPYGFHGTWVAD